MLKNHFMIFQDNVNILHYSLIYSKKFLFFSFLFFSFSLFFLSFFPHFFLLPPIPAYKIWSLPTSAACRIADIVAACSAPTLFWSTPYFMKMILVKSLAILLKQPYEFPNLKALRSTQEKMMKKSSLFMQK